MPAAPRPNFIGIGPGRSGTTWLYRILREHPQVGLSTVKETMFFNREYGRGTDWYLNFFRNCDGKTAIGEVCNTYIFDRDVPARIREFDPRMKLVSCLRNPIDRAFSHYMFLLRNNHASGSFEQVIESDPDILQRGKYAAHLASYFETFPRDQLLILRFEDLQSSPETVAANVYAFVGVASGFEPSSIHERVNPASRPRSRFVASIVKSGAVAVRALGRPEIVHRLKESRLAGMLYRPVARDEYPRMREETRERLRAYFREDLGRLSEMLGSDFERCWLDNADSGAAAGRQDAGSAA